MWYYLQPRVRSSITCWCCIKTAEQIKLVCSVMAALGLLFLAVQRNLGNSKNKGTSVWNFVPNYGLENILQLLSTVASVFNLSGHSVINWRQLLVASVQDNGCNAPRRAGVWQLRLVVTFVCCYLPIVRWRTSVWKVVCCLSRHYSDGLQNMSGNTNAATENKLRVAC